MDFLKWLSIAGALILASVDSWMPGGRSAALAHGGGLDAQGCHHNRKAGGYHCHRGPLAGQHFKSKSEAHKGEGATTEIKGIPRITDGDTIHIGKIRIRLHGIDAPEQRQKCMADGKEWACGREATFALAQAIGQHWVTCTPKDRDRYGRVVAVCKAGDTDFGEWMVKRGWALAYRQYSQDYVRAEQAARALGAGMWRGKFVPPWEWRRGGRLASQNAPSAGSTCIRGVFEATGVECPSFRGTDGRLYTFLGDVRGFKPGDEACVCGGRAEVSICMQGVAIAVSSVRPPGACGNGSAAHRPDCRIKGNISRKGTRIYHVPGGQYYARTRIDTAKGERWFCTEDEARKAGWRRSKR